MIVIYRVFMTVIIMKILSLTAYSTKISLLPKKLTAQT